IGFLAGIKAFTAAVLGGIGNIPGAMLGGLLLGLIETFGAGYLPILTRDVIGPEYKDIFAFIILILVLIFRPMGILGERVARAAPPTALEAAGVSTFNQAMSVQLRAVGAWSRTKKLIVLLLLVTLPLYFGSIMGAIGTVLPLSFFRAGDRYLFRVLDQAGIYVLLTLGLNVVVGYAGLLDLGYVAFYAIGAYSYALVASPQLGLHVPFWLVLPVAPLLAALFGVLLGAPTLRLRGDYLAIVTLGFGEGIRILLNNLDIITNGPRGVT